MCTDNPIATPERTKVEIVAYKRVRLSAIPETYRSFHNAATRMEQPGYETDGLVQDYTLGKEVSARMDSPGFYCFLHQEHAENGYASGVAIEVRIPIGSMISLNSDRGRPMLLTNRLIPNKAVL